MESMLNCTWSMKLLLNSSSKFIITLQFIFSIVLSACNQIWNVKLSNCYSWMITRSCQLTLGRHITQTEQCMLHAYKFMFKHISLSGEHMGPRGSNCSTQHIRVLSAIHLVWLDYVLLKLIIIYGFVSPELSTLDVTLEYFKGCKYKLSILMDKK